jgi:hypothetical protein
VGVEKGVLTTVGCALPKIKNKHLRHHIGALRPPYIAFTTPSSGRGGH